MNIVEKIPEEWVYIDIDNINNIGYNKGKIFYIYITMGTGLLVGTLRYALKYPLKLPGLFKEIRDCHVDPKYVSQTCFISLVSLAGSFLLTQLLTYLLTHAYVYL